MTAIAIQTPSVSTGHGQFPPTPSLSGFTTTAFVNNQPCQLNTVTLYVPHGNTPDFDKWHPADGGTQRIVSSGSSKLIIENKPATMLGENIDCGDVISWGANNAFIE